MAEALKNHFGPEIAQRIAAMLAAVDPAFDRAAFVAAALDGYEALDLLARGWQIAHQLHRHLPADYRQAIAQLVASLGPRLEQTEGQGMAPFLYLPHVFFVAEYGLDHFEESMHAQYELTQRFSAEYSIRPYLERHRDATLGRLHDWARDPSPHVRRLVSEGTRPRLPWAPRLREFQQDPRPVLALLELLKDDPALYVRRSVANNLNDIGKDHPGLLVETARRWLLDASEERRWLVRHALRSAVKRGERGALEVLGVGDAATAVIGKVRISPTRPRIGEAVEIAFALTNSSHHSQRILVDFAIHFVKANGNGSRKVFKLKTIELGARETMVLSKRVALGEMTTRKHYPGRHEVDVVLNGHPQPLGHFDLLPG